MLLVILFASILSSTFSRNFVNPFPVARAAEVGGYQLRKHGYQVRHGCQLRAVEVGGYQVYSHRASPNR